MFARHPIRIQIVLADRLAKVGLESSLAQLPEFVLVEGDCEVVIADLACAMELAGKGAVDGFSGLAKAPSILVVFGPDRERELRQALESRVQGYLVSGFTLEELADGVRAVHRGARYLCSHSASRLAESVYFPPLTDREEAVLALVVEGLCNKSIARQLRIALGTVKSHLKAAYAKLYVGSRTHAIAVAERRGLLMRSTPATMSRSARAMDGVAP